MDSEVVFLFHILAMHLFGLNWHLQPMQRQMYQLSEDNTSGLPFPTDLSLPPLGNTGLEIPNRKGKEESKCLFSFYGLFIFRPSCVYQLIIKSS